MSVNDVGRKFVCERCGEVTREELEKCPQNGCPARKSFLAASVGFGDPMSVAPSPAANPYAFQTTVANEPQLQRPSNWLVFSIIGFYISPILLPVVAYLIGLSSPQSTKLILSFSLYGLGFFELCVVISFLGGWLSLQIWLCRTWMIVPKEHGGLHPAAIVLFQFIPCFNFFWWYRIMPGLSVALGNMRRDQDSHAPDQAGFWFAIAAFATLVLSYFFGGLVILFPFLFAIWLLLANRTKNRYLATRLGTRRVNEPVRHDLRWGE